MPALEGAARGIGQDERGVETMLAQSLADGEGRFDFGEGEHFVEVLGAFPKASEFFVREQCEARFGVCLAQSIKGGQGHDGVAQPVDAANENVLWRAHVDLGRGFQRLCTQNQLAGSRRM